MMNRGATTADWHGTEPKTESLTRHCTAGGCWCARVVRKDRSVKILGKIYRAPEKATQPVPGEVLFFYHYGDELHDPVEWTAPSESDGEIIRYFWKRVHDDE